MQLPFVDRSPTSRRDFERSVVLAFGGEAQESKAIFDVLLPGAAEYFPEAWAKTCEEQ